MTEIANRDALGREQNAHQDIPHGGKPASPDAPRGNLSQGDTTLTTPDDASSINPETLAVRPDGISDEAWEALQEEIRRQSEHQPNLWERTPGYAKALAVFVTTGLTAWGIGHAVSSSSAPDQGKKIVATDTPNGGVATAVPPEVAATAGPTSLVGPTETVSVPVTPEQQTYDPRYYTLAADFPTPELAFRELMRKHDLYAVSGDVRPTIEGQVSLPGDEHYIQALFSDPNIALAGIFENRSNKQSLFAHYHQTR